MNKNRKYLTDSQRKIIFFAKFKDGIDDIDFKS